jgi:hypothetical protein
MREVFEFFLCPQHGVFGAQNLQIWMTFIDAHGWLQVKEGIRWIRNSYRCFRSAR